MLSQSRMMRGLHSNRTRGRKARREGGGNQDNPRDEKFIRSVLEHDEQLEGVCLSIAKTSGECIPPHIFFNKSAPSVAVSPATLGAILYKSKGSRGIMPLAGSRGSAHWRLALAGSRGGAPCTSPPGSRGGATAPGRTLSENPCVWAGAVV